jgi:cell division septation protein DedD
MTSPAAFFTPFFALSTFMEYLLLIGAIVLVAVLVVFWAVAIRKPRSERRYKYHRVPRGEAPPETKRSKRKRRSEPPRNPTLAETRGLPPIRESGPGSNQDYQY